MNAIATRRVKASQSRLRRLSLLAAILVFGAPAGSAPLFALGPASAAPPTGAGPRRSEPAAVVPALGPGEQQLPTPQTPIEAPPIPEPPGSVPAPAPTPFAPPIAAFLIAPRLPIGGGQPPASGISGNAPSRNASSTSTAGGSGGPATGATPSARLSTAGRPAAGVPAGQGILAAPLATVLNPPAVSLATVRPGAGTPNPGGAAAPPGAAPRAASGAPGAGSEPVVTGPSAHATAGGPLGSVAPAASSSRPPSAVESTSSAPSAQSIGSGLQPAPSQTQALPSPSVSPLAITPSSPPSSRGPGVLPPQTAGGTPSAAPQSGSSTGAASFPSAGEPSTILPPASVPKAASGKVSRLVYARPGDEVTIALNGDGWIFFGGTPSGNGWRSGLTYESKTSDAQSTTFVFRANSLGTWGLLFQLQNPGTGSSRDEAVDVVVVSATEFARLMQSPTGGSAGASAAGPSNGTGPGSGVVQGGGSGDVGHAALLERQGHLTEALDSYERNWTPGNPALTQKIAALAYRLKRFTDAKVYWEKNQSVTTGDWADLAVDGLMKTAVAMKDPYELRGMFDQVKGISKIPISTDLLAAGRFLYGNKNWSTALKYLDLFLQRYPQEPGADTACYLVGQIYQGNTPLQNVQAAMDYYHRILNDFPTSDYYGRAQANIAYLNRFYFEIR